MAKSEKVIKESTTSVLHIGRSFYVRVPSDMISDSSFPLLILKDVINKLKKGTVIKIKMLKDKLVIEEK